MSLNDPQAALEAAVRDAAASAIRSVMHQAIDGYVDMIEERYPDMGLRVMAADEVARLKAQIDEFAKNIQEGKA